VTSILVSGDNCTIKGLDRVMQRGHGVQIRGNNNRVIGCTISGPLHSGVYVTGGFGGPTATGNMIGGTAPGEGNKLSAGNDGVRIDAPADGNIVIGNVLTGSFHGASIRGSIYTTTANNNRIGGPTAEERNIIADAGHYGEEGFPDGAQVNVEYARGTILQGNYIGTTADGTASAGQIGPAGIRLLISDGTIIRDNIIGGIAVDGVNHYAGQRFGVGISVIGTCDATQVYGNRIGTDVSGSSPIPNRTGIALSSWPGDGSPTQSLIGGQAEGDGNLIVFNELDGVSVGGTVGGVAISGNSIHSNGQLGIDLDPGANGSQSAPVLTAASSTGTSVTIDGSLTSAANNAFTVEFFANEACDPSGFGEGAVFLGSSSVMTDGEGDAAFSATLSTVVSSGAIITATATHVATGETSEFSNCVAVAGGLLGDLDDDGDVDLADYTIFSSCWRGPDKSMLLGCDGADLDADGDTDFRDYAEFAALIGK
jgi:titin